MADQTPVRVLAREAVLSAAVQKAAQTFDAYTAMHAAKGSVQGDNKAAINKHLAEEMRKALAVVQSTPAPDLLLPGLLAADALLAEQGWRDYGVVREPLRAEIARREGGNG